MTKILLTGFEPFGGMRVNPSQLIVDRISKEGIDQVWPVELNCAILPVRFRDSALKMKSLLEAFRPQLIVSLGIDLGKKNIELESTAHKFSKYIDADYLIEQKENLPDIHQTQIDLTSLREILVKKGHNVIVSDDSGAYVCNHIYYLTHQFGKELELNAETLFVHVPYSFPYFANHIKIEPDFSIEEIYNATRALLIELYKNHQKKLTI